MIRGRLSGVDALAEEWAIHNELPYIGVPALWSAQGKGAGPIRNQLIVDSELIRPDICVAFPGGRGTADMVRRCMAAGISVLEG
jgi:hypothetical protein